MKKIILIIILIGVIIVSSILAFYQSSLKKELLIKEDTKFTVVSGESVSKIVSNLKDKGIIGDTYITSIYLKQNPDKAKNFKAGEFVIKKGMNIKDLVETLQGASVDRNDVLVLIPEGLRHDEIAELLSKSFEEIGNSNFKKSEYIEIAQNPDNYEFKPEVKDFLKVYKPEGKTLEGFLYPETYFFPKDASAIDVINTQINTLSGKMKDDDFSSISKSKYSFYEYLTMASMIEREAFTKAEKPEIADIILKRLEKGVLGVKLLQIDATLLYQAKDWKADPVREKAKDGPYNTYTRSGLPPTPISNPGIDSILATIYPNSNNYYFYLHDKDGKIYFAKTQAEHDINVRRYIRN